MTYYEELGVERTASAEEIRRAYRKLAQLLHPDQQQDEGMRRICERQMVRLNGIAEVLDDPVRRRAYDLGLEEGRRGWRVNWSAWVWAAAGVAGLALLAALFVWNSASSGAAVHQEPAKPAAQNDTAVAEVPKREEAREAAVLPRRAKESPKPAKTGDLDDREVAIAAVPIVVPERIPVAVVEARPSAPPPEASVKPSPARSYFAGEWFYSKEVSERDQALYPPEMVEMTITEESGQLRGKYRGRYRVTDRPISPDVRFEFSGPAGEGETAELGWTGTGGAEGRVKLKAITRVSMEVSWWATRMGALDLTSGTAVLIRAEER